jgi:uncharacterized protein
MTCTRAWVLLPSGRRLNPLDPYPDPDAWTNDDLAIGLSRTYRWAGYSAWDLPLSVAQHSLTVLALATRFPGPVLSPAGRLRELLHDATEALLYRRHKQADALAAASEAVHVAGWSREALRDDLEITIAPLTADPLAPTHGRRPWEPWPPIYAAGRFPRELRVLQTKAAAASRQPTSTGREAA